MLSADIFITPTQSAWLFPSAIMACIHLLKTNLQIEGLKCGRSTIFIVNLTYFIARTSNRFLVLYHVQKDTTTVSASAG